MTVGELKKLLDQFHDDNPVLIGDSTAKICTDIVGIMEDLPFPLLIIEHGSLDLDEALTPTHSQQFN